ncbi:hypothetical protein PQ469_23495 [Mucilaginibacter sp. KACC 22773]|uniref:hypothetical protein n=1 Tax=Mucilaginibacter sp. KACC 22773 TaxID=3025671 RepID=UPI0023659A0C|nr:hypothetical protein [Mucilaginibacter sp. KACC 22773]WDF76852.1 hypothetical protein PQ469_23495 [Mucilaginibacter sp. KACC 22773]
MYHPVPGRTTMYQGVLPCFTSYRYTHLQLNPFANVATLAKYYGTRRSTGTN